MASCLGPDCGKLALKELLIGLGKALIACVLTITLIHLICGEQLAEIRRNKIVMVSMFLVTAPICFGFYALFRQIIPRDHDWCLSLTLSSLASAATAVWLLPTLLIYFFFIIFALISRLFS